MAAQLHPPLALLPTEARVVITWDPADPESVDGARAAFAQLRGAGYAVFAAVPRAGASVETRAAAFPRSTGAFVARSPVPRQTDEFPPEAGRVVAVRPMRGG